MTQNYNFAPVGPFALKSSAENTAEKYGGHVVEVPSMLYGTGYFVVPLDMDDHFCKVAP